MNIYSIYFREFEQTITGRVDRQWLNEINKRTMNINSVCTDLCHEDCIN